MIIRYRDDAPLTVAAAIDLYNRSGLGERRPVDRPDIFAGMLKNANLTVTAWDGVRLAGIGRALIAETRARLASECMIVLLAAPQANGYYPKVGFEHHPRAWVMKGALD